MSSLSDFIGRVKLKQLEISDALCQGIETFDSYQRLVGKHQGLSEALSILNQLLEEDDKDHDL